MRLFFGKVSSVWIVDFPARRVTWMISWAFIFRTLYVLCFKIVSFSCHAKSSWEKQVSRRAGYPYWATRLQQRLQSRLPISISGWGGQWSQTWKNEEKMSPVGNAANLHLIRGTLTYLIQHISHDVTSLLFVFSAFVCVYCIHEGYCAFSHSATPLNISTHTHTHTTHYVPVVPHKAVAEVSKRAKYRRLVAVTHGSQSKSTDGWKSGWRQRSVVVVVVVLVAAM